MPKGKRNRRLRLAEAQNWRCAYCAGCMHLDGMRLDGATIEHLVPVIQGGSHGTDNLVSACLACNNARSGFYSARIFYKVRRWQLRKGAWPACTSPNAKVRKRLLRIFVQAEQAHLAKIASLEAFTSMTQPFAAGPEAVNSPTHVAPECLKVIAHLEMGESAHHHIVDQGRGNCMIRQ